MRLVLLLIGLVVGFAAGIFFTVYYFDQLVTALGPVLGVKEISSQTAFGEIQQAPPSIGLPICWKLPNGKYYCGYRPPPG